MPMDGVWGNFPDLIEQLKKLFADNASNSVIAKTLGHGITRSAVIGKMRRMGLNRPKKPAKPKYVPKNPQPPRFKDRVHVAQNSRVEAYTEALDFTIVPPDDSAIPTEQRKTILTIGMNDCRYPIGEPTSPDFFFCGAPKVEHGPYCAHHMKRCYYTPTSKPFSASYINRVR